MNRKNIIKEGGILDKIYDLLKKRKLKKLQKAFRNQPEIRKRILHINKDAQEIAKWYRKEFGKDVPKDFFV